MITRPLAYGTGALCLATLLAYGGRWVWLCELLVNFRTHFALLLGIALIVAAATRHWRIAGAALLGVALNVWPMYGVYFDSPWPAEKDAKPVRVVAFNVLVSNRAMPEVARYLNSLAADVVVLEEMNNVNAKKLLPLLPAFGHHFLAIEDRGIMILSRWPLIAPAPVIRVRHAFGARADVDLGDRRLRLFGVHLNWPVMPRSAWGRNAQLSALGDELGQCEGACVVVGDFNTTPWSAHFRRLKSRSGFRDCTAGRGFLPTWSSRLPSPLRLRIDHCLVSPAVSVAGVQVGESVGSDHFATINDLLVARAP